MQIPKIIYTGVLRFKKRAWNKVVIAHQMQTFFMQEDVQPTKSYSYTFRLKHGPKLSIFRSQNAN